MNDIETWVKEFMTKVNASVPGGLPMRKLLVALCAIVGGVMAYKWLKENLAKLLEV